ncbi:MAG: MBOAT family protein [Lachnospiraceae bacterium]|nr:MBOAT family protein [Lachnospiraceae bacterium]
MSFISITFALFVACVLAVYYIFPKKIRWVVLLVASYVFYTWTGFDNIAYILITTVSAYICAMLIEKRSAEQKKYLSENKESLTKEEKKAYKAGVKKKQKLILAAGLLINFGILVYLKYADWAIAYINLFRLNRFGRTDFIPFKNYVIPLGISFYTFQTMGYLIDIYYGKYERECNFFKFALFTSFFPQIIQGPISRFGELAPELYKEVTFDFDRIKSGFYRIMWGLFKKLVIADRLAAYVSDTIAQRETYKGFYILLAVFFYSMQIYGDFSGGIDVALGVAEMFGIRLAENFNRPFFSKSISEYWTRWHITLGTWFKDYIFYPLSLNKGIIKLGKKCREAGSSLGDKKNALAGPVTWLGKRIPIYIPMFIVWFTTGMWHGSQNRYVVWGLFNCFFIILGTELEPVSQRIVEKHKLNEAGFMMRAYRVIKTFWLMSFLRIFDISKDVPSAFNAFRLIFTDWSSFRLETVYENLSLPKEDFIVAVIAILVMFAFDLVQRKGSVRERIFRLPVPAQWVVLSLLIVAVSVLGYYGPGYDAGSFIYGAF